MVILPDEVKARHYRLSRNTALSVLITASVVMIFLFQYPRYKSITNLPRMELSDADAYCTSRSIHANCVFDKSLCYDISSKLWQASSMPYQQWSGVSLRSRGSLFRDAARVSSCNQPFIPENLPNPSEESILWIEGTNVFSCIWVNVFGHIFLEMMLPAWLAMRNIADHRNLSDQNITYVLDDRCHCPLAGSSFGLLTKQPIHKLNALISTAQERKKSHVCFERLIVGYRLQSSLEYAHNVAHLGFDDLPRFRDSVKKLHNFPLNIDMSNGSCIALLLQRGHTRRIVADSEEKIIKMLRERTFCQVRKVFFEGLSIIEQVRLVSMASIFVHVSGSGSHHFVWLANGGASITIVHPYLGLRTIGNGAPGGGGLILNDFLCWRHRNILCVTAAAKSLSQNFTSDVEVDLESFSNALDMVKLWQNRGIFDPRDQSE